MDNFDKAYQKLPEHFRKHVTAKTRQQTLSELAKWVTDTCILFGASVGTSHKVAGIFVDGLEREIELEASEGE